MTASELKQALSKFPDDMKIEVDIGPQVSSIDKILPFIVDGNIRSIVLDSSQLWGFQEKKR